MIKRYIIRDACDEVITVETGHYKDEVSICVYEKHDNGHQDRAGTIILERDCLPELIKTLQEVDKEN